MERKLPIYLDFAASTALDERVTAKMIESLDNFGNSASSHAFGKTASEAILQARNEVASLIKAEPNNIIWTSGATESNNLAIKGIAQFYQSRGKHIITSQTEHRSVLDACLALASLGFEISYLKPNKQGIIEPDLIQSALRPDTILVSLMHANNETGAIQDIEAIGKLLRSHSPNIFFHVDAAQSVGKIAIDLTKLDIDLMSFSAHKVYGPKGVGALFIRIPKVRLNAQIHGGGQERGIRSGTLPTHQCVGMGEAFRVAREDFEQEQCHQKALRKLFWDGIKELPGVFLNGHPENHLPNIMNVCFSGQDRDIFQEGLKDLAFSGGSACAGTNLDTSHVLRAMGLTNEMAHCSIRFSFGRYTTRAEIEYAIDLIRKRYLGNIN